MKSHRTKRDVLSVEPRHSPGDDRYGTLIESQPEGGKEPEPTDRHPSTLEAPQGLGAHPVNKLGALVLSRHQPAAQP